MAEHVTEVTPSGNVEPDRGEQDADNGPSTVSVACAVNVARAPPGPVASRVMLAGTVTSGAVVSRTVTVNVAGATIPWGSVGPQTTPGGASGDKYSDDRAPSSAAGPAAKFGAPNGKR